MIAKEKPVAAGSFTTGLVSFEKLTLYGADAITKYRVSIQFFYAPTHLSMMITAMNRGAQ